MKVDRNGFLHLVTVIAGGAVTCVACGAKQEPQSAIMVPVDPPPDASAPMSTMPVATSTETAPERAPEKPPVETPAPIAASGGIWTLPYDASKKPHACSDLKCPGPTQEAMGVLRKTCTTIQGRLATEPFQRFMSCMIARNNTTDTCDLRLVSERQGDCLHGWTETPKIDPATASKCTPIVAKCGGSKRSIHASKGITMDDCQKILSVTNAKSEAKMIHCVTEYCGEALTLCHGGYG